MEGDVVDINPATIVCTECGGMMLYKGAGVFRCEKCGHEEMNDYGKVRAYLEKNGPSNILEISAATDLPKHVISNLLKEGRLEVASKANGGGHFCKRCGMGIRMGDYCSRCQSELDGLDDRNRKKGVYNSLKDSTGDSDSRMRFLGDEK